MTASPIKLTTRPLIKSDFDPVVNIDAKITGRLRPGFFQKRMDAALTEPKHFIYIGCEFNGELQGFLMARLLEGEYGLNEPVAVLDVIGVDPSVQGVGLGKALMQAFDDILEHKQIAETKSQADWRNQRILRFFSAAGFMLAPRYVLEREVSYMATNNVEESDAYLIEETENDFSGPVSDQPGALSRNTIYCRSLQPNDLDTLVRIDQKVTGIDRRSYYERKVKEALDESGIRVSLVAELNGMVVGFIMARVDYGEFDRTESNAVLDTIGVDPGFTHHYVGAALLAQLLGNFATLRLEKIRTEIDAEQFDLTSFLINNNFYPAQRLSFTYKAVRN